MCLGNYIPAPEVMVNILVLVQIHFGINIGFGTGETVSCMNLLNWSVDFHQTYRLGYISQTTFESSICFYREIKKIVSEVSSNASP